MFEPTATERDFIIHFLKVGFYATAAYLMVEAYLDWKSNARVS